MGSFRLSHIPWNQGTLIRLVISKVGKGAPFTESGIEMVSIICICRQAVMALENLKAMDEKAE